jgi:hypothetical protein
LAALVPVIDPFPLLAIVVLGLTLSGIALWQTVRAPRQLSAAFQNIVLIVVHVGIVLMIFQPWRVPVGEAVILPHGFMGTALILYGIPTGGSLERDSSGALTYRIPSNGLLLIRDAVPEHTIYRRDYYILQPDGSLVPITAHWYTTIHETDPDFHASILGTYLEGGGVSTPVGGGCKFNFQSFVIGTKQSIRSSQRVTEPEMLRAANLKC